MNLDMTVEDINRTYGGTYVGLTQADGTIDAMYIENARGNDDDPELVTSMGSYSADDDCIRYEFPEAGMVQLDNYCRWYERRAERQWHRGIRQRSFVGDVSNLERMVVSMFNPVTFTLAEYKDRRSSRLSSTFSVASDGVVRYRNTDVALFDEDKNELAVVNDAAAQIIALEEWVNDTTIRIV